jgi:hypothetical protein
MITILGTVNTKSSKQKAMEWLKAKRKKVLFLNLPIDQEAYIKEIAEGIDWRKVLQSMKEDGLIKEPEDVQSYRALEPVFEGLPLIDNVFCFRDPLYHDFCREVSREILILTFRARLGNINIEEWKKIIEEEVRFGVECSKREAEYICRRLQDDNICIDACKDVESFLRKKGHEIERIELDKPCKPLDILREKIRREIIFGEEISNEDIKRLIQDHLVFTDLIIKEGFEEACRSWQEGRK